MNDKIESDVRLRQSNPPLAGAAPLFSAERWQQMRVLLALLDDASNDVREAELAKLATSDPDFAEQARALLASSPAQLMHLADALLPFTAEQMPERVGPFRLLERIGLGGMGTVYLAEREHADFVQRVALKLLDGSSARLAQLASRERRILAALAHPNITAFVDAGTQDGRAWIAMEYVQGESLSEYCKQHDISVRERVRLFDQVCAAVAHAHAQLVVHRDLKPSNVLVDVQGRAKLLDFGIAVVVNSVADAMLTPATRVFTPEYAAPEQFRGEHVTTACDIYSLGLMLYELVANQRLLIKDRATREQPWSTAELAAHARTQEAAVKAVSKSKQVKAQRAHAQLLQGDLGRIIAHALNPEPSARYSAVPLLREDLTRWLQDRTLTITQPTTWQLLRRFVHRHRAAVAATTAAFAVILVLAATAVLQARAKTLEAARAQAALRQSEATRNFMNSVFLSADPFYGKGAQTSAGDLLAAARIRIDRELSAQPEIAANLLYQIGNVYVSLRDTEAVRETLSKALAYNQRSAQPSAALEGSARARLAFETYNQNRDEAALSELAAAITVLRIAEPEAPIELSAALRMQGNLLFARGDQNALAVSRESMQIAQLFPPEQSAEYPLAVQAHANMLVALENFDEALAVVDKALSDPRTQANEQAEVGVRGQRAQALIGLKRYQEANAAFTAVIAAMTASHGVEHSDTRFERYSRAALLESMGHLDAAAREVQALIDVPASGSEHHIAPIARALAAARISEARRAKDAGAQIERAGKIACGKQGHAEFCGATRLLAANLAIRELRYETARSILDVGAHDAAIKASALLRNRLNLMRLRLLRSTQQWEAAQELLSQARKAELSPTEAALIDVESGLLDLATGDHTRGRAALARGRAYLAQSLIELTPQIREIDAALAAAENAR